MQVCYFFGMPHRERQQLQTIQNEEVYDGGDGGNGNNVWDNL